MRILFIVLALFFLVVTVLPIVRHDWWVVRACDFPRQQIFVAGTALVGTYVFVWDTAFAVEDVVLGALVLAVAYQGYWIWPYTPYANVQVQPTEVVRRDDRLTVMVANVWVQNRQADRYLALVRRNDPDVILTLEVNDWWDAQLEALEETHPHTIRHPRPDAYGLAVHSRYPLRDAEVRFIVNEKTPSVRTWVELPSGRSVRFYGIHPRPPHPEDAPDTIDRDAELLMLSNEVDQQHSENGDPPIVVAGDFNDVSWSYITLLFRRISGLLDPRIGRGPFNTFHAHYPFFRCPLDHVAHSHHFTVSRLERLPEFGSDHFALLCRLQLEREPPRIHNRPYATSTMRRHAREEIDKAFVNVESASVESASVEFRGSSVEC